jgi:hypothetical protein
MTTFETDDGVADRSSRIRRLLPIPGSGEGL